MVHKAGTGVLLLGVLWAASACTSDERWEGRLKACSSSVANDTKILLVLDTPRPPRPTGYMGKASENADETWTLTEIEDAVGPLSSIKFTATYSVGAREEWEVELTGGATTLEGDASIDTNTILGTINIKCDVELKREG